MVALFKINKSAEMGVYRPSPLTVTSFFTPGGYYEEKAEELRAQCEDLGMAHHIKPLRLSSTLNWAEICRRKVRFYHDALKKLQRPIMWVDVDSRILRNLDHLAEGPHDMALFARGFQYLPQYNITQFARSFHPGYLLLKPTETTFGFLDRCAEVDATHQGEFTDDYIIEEAFRTTRAQPRLLVLTPRDILRPGDTDNGEALFRHGDSGNVGEYKTKVRQHMPRLLEPSAQRTVINELAKFAAKGKWPDRLIFLYRYLLNLDPEDYASYLKLLNLHHRRGNLKPLNDLLESGAKSDILRPYALRFRLVRALEAGEWEKADELFADIRATGNEAVINFARSRLFRHSFDRRAEANAIPEDERVKLFWWEEPFPGNLGDIINPYVIEGLTGVPPKFAPRGQGLSAIGSVIKFAKEATPVWGSGSPHATEPLESKAKYYAVRGPLTRNLVIESGGSCPEVYGDPAWALPLLYLPEVEKTHKTGLILHFTHEAADLRVDPAIRSIGIRRCGINEIEAFLDEMLSCERIVSTSLHGVIIAHAYGLPACWATVSGARQQIHGDGTKFADYYASVGVYDPVEPLDLSRLETICDSALPDHLFRPIKHRIDLPKLLEAAPFDIRPEFRTRAQNFMER